MDDRSGAPHTNSAQTRRGAAPRVDPRLPVAHRTQEDAKGRDHNRDRCTGSAALGRLQNI
jgi:hypothetical protein